MIEFIIIACVFLVYFVIGCIYAFFEYKDDYYATTEDVTEAIFLWVPGVIDKILRRIADRIVGYARRDVINMEDDNEAV